MHRIDHSSARRATAPTAWRTERRAQAGAIRAIRDSDGGLLACAQAVARGAREAVGACSCAVLVLHSGAARVLAEAGEGAGAGAEIDVAAEAAAATRIAVPVRFDERDWGALTACCPDGAPEDAADILAPFAELMSLSLSTEAARRRLRTLAATDALTGLPNRRAFDASLVRACERATRVGPPVSLAVLDLDRFKEVNDRLGHRAGDEVLAEAACRLSDAARSDDVVARIGGEEFGWILPGLDARAPARAVERARRAVSGASFAAAGRLTISAGVSDLTSAGSAGRMMEAADLMRYRAKAEGRNAVRPSPEPALAADG